MKNITDIEEVAIERRYGSVSKEKSEGATYTPVRLADFVAEQMLEVADLPKSLAIRILDPAVGDGALLDALLKRLPKDVLERVEVYGFDTDSNAIDRAGAMLRAAHPNIHLQLEIRDFLIFALDEDRTIDLFIENGPHSLFHLVIANPPYVRTQIIGASEAQKIAACFGLTGRVDLYYPFMLGISKILAPRGAAGIITSNRFMTTKSGQSVRREMLACFGVSRIFDLGDTKLFDAAVLPSVLIASGLKEPRRPSTEGVIFCSIYENHEQSENPTRVPDVFEALKQGSGVYRVSDGRFFVVKSGTLDNGGMDEGVWRVASMATDDWLAKVEAHTWATFNRIGKIHVGVKTTADKVFIRSDWDTLEGGRPELLRPLITRHNARRFKADKPKRGKPDKWILYTHEIRNGKRAPVNLSLYPRAAAYLEHHRATLEARDYLINAGRRWFEIWVPQDPDAWSSPKLVFPDISKHPTFWIDTDGGVVNGECYWLRCNNENEQDLLWLALAVANSTFIEVFYDHRFNNKLYAGRRRFITQYVERFPLPDPNRPESRLIIALTKKIYALLPSAEADRLATDLNGLVWKVFGVDSEKVAG